MADQRHLGLRPLLFAEQTVRHNFVNFSELVLKKLSIENGRDVQLWPILTKSEGQSLVVDVGASVVNNPILLHIKMIGDHNSTAGPGQQRNPTNPSADIQTAEGHVIILKAELHCFKNVVSLPPTLRKPFSKLTVLLTVYDLGSRPRPSAGVHLNRARLQGTHCDMKLVVDGVELPAHRAVLAVRSAVLSNILTGDFKEAREGRIQLVDTSRVAVEKFLEYIYTDHIENWEGSELELLHLADKYMVPELRTECSMRLWSCDPLQALEVLHAAAAGLSEVISSSLRQRLTSIVVDNIEALGDTQPWADFKAAYPFLVDIMLGSSANGKSDENGTFSVWTQSE